MKRTLSLITAAAIGLFTLGAVPANAEPGVLPEGDALFGISCPYYSTEPGMLPPLQLMWLNPANAEVTLVGSGTIVDNTNCAGQAAWNAVTGKVYAMAHAYDYDESPTILVVIDAVTGASTVVAVTTEGGVPVDIWDIAIDADGNAFALGDEYFYAIDLETAELTPLGEAHSATGMSFDPVSGILYSIGSDGSVLVVDPTDGSWEFVGYLPASSLYSFAIDSAGVFWFAQDDYNNEFGNYEAILWSMDPANPDSATEVGRMFRGSTYPYPMSMVVVPGYVPAPPPAPQLADTGSSVEGTALGAAVVLGLLGAGLLVARRRRAA